MQAGAKNHSPETLGTMLFLYCIVGVIGIGLYNMFTWRVFRPRDTWSAARGSATGT